MIPMKNYSLFQPASLVRFVLIPMIAIMAQSLFGQDTLRLSLNDAISLGLKQNYNITISEQELRIAQNNNTPGAAGRYPSFDFRATQGNSFLNSESRTQADVRDQLYTNYISPAVTVNWTIFDGFRVNITKKNLEDLENLSEGFSALVVQNTVQAIILAYNNMLLQQEKLAVFDELKALSRDRLLYMRTKQEFGSAVTFDVLLANDNYLTDSVNYLQQESSIRNAALLMKLLLALDDGVEVELTDDFSVQIEEYAFEDLKSKMFSNNRTLLNQYLNQKIYENSTELAQSSKYPELFLGSGADYANTRQKYEGQEAATAYSFGYYANFTLRFNIYNGGATRRAFQNAVINENIGLIEIEQMRKNLGNQLRNQYDQFLIRKKLLTVAESSQQSAGLNLQIAEERFKAGAINSFNYRDVQLSYLNSSIRRLEAVFNLISTETDILRLTGGIISENN